MSTCVEVSPSPHDCPPDQPGDDPLVSELSLDQPLQVDGDGVGPGELAVLLPPPLDHQRDVEAEEEGDRNSSALVSTPPTGQLVIPYTGPGPISTL